MAANQAALDSKAELNLRICRSLVAYLSIHCKPGVLTRAAKKAGLTVETLDECSAWVSHAQFELLLAACREELDSDEAFKKACAFRPDGDGYGPLRLLMGASTIWSGYIKGCRFMGLVTRISRFEPRRERKKCIIRYVSERQESHLMCLSRQAQIETMPTLFGLPPAQISSTKCLAKGDDCCEYEFYLVETRRWVPAVLGLIVGLAASAVIKLVGINAFYLLPLFPLIGAVIGHALELHRAGNANRALALELQTGLREMAEDESEARRALLDLHQREHLWARAMEEQAAARSRTLEGAVGRLQDLQEQRVIQLRGFTHDLRNPLTAIFGNLPFLEEELKGPEGRAALRDMGKAATQMQKLLTELMDTLTSEAQATQFAPAPLEVAPLADELRRRLSALLYGRQVRGSVFATREAPERVEVDHLLFDRVTDNLLTNAAKYTESGSIIVEIGGTPGFMTIKVSDTGRGIAPEVIEQIFEPQGSSESSRTPGSYGVGLSVVVQLLASVGGRLEVISKPKVGTTFWAHFPISFPEKKRLPAAASSKAAPKQDKVVFVRKVID